MYAIIAYMKRTTVFLTENQLRQLKKYCDVTGLKFSEVLRRAIDEFLKSKDVQQSIQVQTKTE
jgi:hypothetical protein